MWLGAFKPVWNPPHSLVGSSCCLCQLLSPSSWAFVTPRPEHYRSPLVQPRCLCSWKLLLKIFIQNRDDLFVHPYWCPLFLHLWLAVLAFRVQGPERRICPRALGRSLAPGGCLEEEELGHVGIVKGLVGVSLLCCVFWKTNIRPGMRKVMQLMSPSSGAGKCVNHPDLP